MNKSGWKKVLKTPPLPQKKSKQKEFNQFDIIRKQVFYILFLLYYFFLLQKRPRGLSTLITNNKTKKLYRKKKKITIEINKIKKRK